MFLKKISNHADENRPNGNKEKRLTDSGIDGSNIKETAPETPNFLVGIRTYSMTRCRSHLLFVFNHLAPRLLKPDGLVLAGIVPDALEHALPDFHDLQFFLEFVRAFDRLEYCCPDEGNYEESDN